MKFGCDEMHTLISNSDTELVNEVVAGRNY